MKYNYRCINLQCTERNEEITITKPLKDSDKIEYCEKCKEPLQRIFTTSIKTSDGFKK